MFKGIDLYSDTVTKPTAAMRAAIAEAEVGDEQKGEDPTTLKLQVQLAEILGKDSAIFLPSATMANEIAIRAVCDPGDELFAAEASHIFFAEAGGPAVHSGVMARPLKTETGIFSGSDLLAAYRWAKGPLYPVSKLVSVENTTNMGGGQAWSEAELDAVLTTAKELGLKTHLDGARLFNAVVKSNLSAKKIASRFDLVTICLSKGLGCPAGALLAFDESYFPKIRRLKQLMGGALRQSGILAAAGIHALDHHIDRLKEDHENAERLAAKLSEGLAHLTVENPRPSTNMVYFRWRSATLSSEKFLEACTERGLRFSHVGPDRFRAVTHLDIKRGDIEKAVLILKEVCNS